MRLAIVIALAACGGAPATRPTERPPVEPAKPPAAPPEITVIGVALVITPIVAEVSIDDIEHGPASKLPKAIALEPGLHWLVVSLDGYEPYRAEFTVSDKTEKFTVRLERKR